MELLREQLRLSEERRLSDFDRQSAFRAEAIGQFNLIGRKLDDISTALISQADVLAIPRVDVPTVEELLIQAKSDEAVRRTLQNTLAELEFENVEVEFN